ncbi:hypothetical protein HOE22_08520 [Candidatus Woesearchaeota archaeon]|jgi:hypothetical protein|nr:hypothetical protein [Candidatus Woesearchaeota archaeon]
MKKREKMSDSTFGKFNPMALREKYSAGINKISNPFSSFWADSDWDERRTEFLDDEEYVKPKVDHVALASYRRAIANFVSIVTNDPSIPVVFQNNDSSFTDGKKVTIGSKINEKNFDPVVGLALHEGSHIKLSDFDLLRNLENNIPEELFLLGESKGYSRHTVLSHTKSMLNYVEDRRIDFHIFSTSPGYKGYYHSMYKKYFHSKVIDKALLTDEYTSLDWDSYIFRILNMTNKNSRLDVLPGLGKMYYMVFKKNGGVKKLKSSDEALSVALDVMFLVYENLLDGVEKTDPDTGEVSNEPNHGQPGESDKSDKLSDEAFDSLLESIENNVMSGGDSEGGMNIDLPTDGGSSNGTPSNDKKTKKIELTESQKKSLERAIEKQKDFTNGETKKTGKLSKKDNEIVKTMEEAGVTHKVAGEGCGSGEYDYNTGEYLPGKGVKVVFVKKLTKYMIEERLFPSLLGSRYYGNSNEDSINNGIKIGTRLGKKLQVRGESRDTKWTRKDSGRIDKRLIAELGFGNDRVFSTTFVESYSDAYLHISVDASGSMGGDKWDNTMTSVVTICKATSMIQNVDVVVSFRSTHDAGRYRSSESLPLILIGYDSRVDKISKIKNLWTGIHPGGTTPEGLCFEAIMDEIVPDTNDRDSYFLNFSDGMPMYSNTTINYYRDTALNHTKKMVNELRGKGIKVLSYFIGGEYERESTMGDFKKMYGNDAEFINVTNVMEISKTMNKKFLEK